MLSSYKLLPYYRTQTKFAKVMFSQVSVCPHKGVSAPLHAGIHPPGQTPPSAQCMLGYGQQAGGTHPTGMHSCSERNSADKRPIWQLLCMVTFGVLGVFLA